MKEVSEKTLEINVAAEMLHMIRKWRGYEAAFWIGMKQHEEAKTGLDVSLSGLPERQFLGLQFKSPWGSRPDQNPYRYYVNELQQSNLMELARGDKSVYYVFPNFNTLNRLRSTSPELMGNTYMVHVNQVGDLGSDRKRRHRVECYEPNGRVSVNSPVEIQRAPTAKVFLTELGESLQNVAAKEALGLISRSELRSWLLEIVRAGAETRRVGQLLRGFAVLAL
jgi:hypothetical protein